jgi:uncharacterized protein YbbC (DUF1343 family)
VKSNTIALLNFLDMKKCLFLVFLSVIGFYLTFSVTAQKVKTGLEVLQTMDFAPLKGKRVGLITNPTGVDHQLRSNIDILFASKECKLVALFGPEHGVRGDYAAGDYVSKFYRSRNGNSRVQHLRENP